MNATFLWYLAKKFILLRSFLLKIIRLLYSCDISIPRKMGSGICLEHNALGCVISSESEIGNNCHIYQNVTIGAGKGGYPIIGNNVIIYGNSTICGKIYIGDNVIIGANSFVNSDIPDNCVAAGVPARVLYKK